MESGALSYPTVAVRKLLHGAERRCVRFTLLGHQGECAAEFRVQRRCTVPHYRQPAAFLRAIFGERGHNDMSSRFHRMAQCADVRRPLF